jgi:GxxExxY protein
MSPSQVDDLPTLVHEVISRAQAVRFTLGAGYPAALYLEALRVELARDLGVRKVDKLFAQVDGKALPFRAGPTVVVGRAAVVHAVVVDQLNPRHRAALSRRIDALELRAGVLLNFADDDIEAYRSFADDL